MNDFKCIQWASMDYYQMWKSWVKSKVNKGLWIEVVRIGRGRSSWIFLRHWWAMLLLITKVIVKVVEYECDKFEWEVDISNNYGGVEDNLHF